MFTTVNVILEILRNLGIKEPDKMELSDTEINKKGPFLICKIIPEMHQGFQRGLFRLRLLAARNLADSLLRSSNLISTDSNLPLKMSAQVCFCILHAICVYVC